MKREVELKYRLQSQADLDKALAVITVFGGAPYTLNQTNYFFDTDDYLLQQNKFAIRLRKQNNNYFLTIKGKDLNPQKKDSSLSVRLEYEISVPAGSVPRILKGVVNPLQFLFTRPPETNEKLQNTRKYLVENIRDLVGKRKLSLVGSFDNHRTCVPFLLHGCKLLLEFDVTEYGNKDIFYEVELEIPEEVSTQQARKFLTDLLRTCNIEFSTSSSKAERFFEQL